MVDAGSAMTAANGAVPATFDVDEWRDTPVRHRYVHGQMGADLRFAFHFPPPEQYEGRFLHHLEGGFGGHEDAVSANDPPWSSIAYAFECGAYLVGSNQGHIGNDMSGSGGDGSVHAWRASLAVAQLGRRLAEDMYHEAPHHGYLFGISGGGHRAITCLEHGAGTWDGAVPVNFGPDPLTWFTLSATARAFLLLHDVADRIIDATEPGGTGDPFLPDLTSEQRDALATVYRMGLPRGGEAALGDLTRTAVGGMWPTYAPQLVAADPAYFERDFWSLPGYAGFDEADALAGRVIDYTATVSGLRTARQLGLPIGAGASADDIVAILLDPGAGPLVTGARIAVTSGKESGRARYCSFVRGGLVLCWALSNDLWGDLAVGDQVHVDNRHFVAFGYWHRHQLGRPGDTFPDRLSVPELGSLHIDRTAVFPQRDAHANCTMHDIDNTGDFTGRMIILQSMLDTGAWTNNALHYVGLVGRTHADDVRLYLSDNAGHAQWSPRFINYGGLVQQAIRDLIDWVERDIEPAASTAHTYDKDNRIHLPATAAERGGLQPTVTLTVDGSPATTVEAGAEVDLALTAACPPGGGVVVETAADFDGTGEWIVLDGGDPAPTVTVNARHRYTEPGRRFPMVRVVAHRSGEPHAESRRMENVARARVVVVISPAPAGFTEEATP